MRTLTLLALFPATILVVGACGTAQNEAQTQNWPLIRKVAEHSVKPWYPNCVFGGCWHDYEIFEGTWGAHKVVFKQGDYGLKTGGKIHFQCKEGREVTFQMPNGIDPGWESQWIENPCHGAIRKITLKAGLDGTWGNASLAIFRRFP